MALKIVIDAREPKSVITKIKKSLDNFKNNNLKKNNKVYKDFTYELSTLDVGDFVIYDEYNNPKICIERKTYSDMASSIKDNRSKEQAARLLQYEKQYKCKAYYLIETSKDVSLDVKNVLQCVINKQFKHNFGIIRTLNMTETAFFIKGIIKCVCENGFYGDKSIVTTIPYVNHKKGNIKIGTVVSTLQNIKGVSPIIATSVYKSYPDLNALIVAFKNKGEGLLIGTVINDKRKIGKAISKKIHDNIINN